MTKQEFFFSGDLTNIHLPFHCGQYIYFISSLPLYEYKLYHEMSPEPIAVVSKSLAPSGDSYGIRVRPTFPNPVLLLAACCAIDKMYHRQATILA